MTKSISKSLPQQIVTSSVALRDGALNLKVAAVFYQRIVILDDRTFDTKLRKLVGPELDGLVNEGVVEVRPVRPIRDFRLGQEHDAAVDGTSSLAMEGMLASRDSKTRRAVIAAGANGFVRLESAELSLNDPTTTFVPNISAKGLVDERSAAAMSRNEKLAWAADILFKEVPVPAEDTPWQDIFNFRKDNATELAALKLHHWMKKVTAAEDLASIKDEVRHDYLSFEERLKVHRMKCSHARFRVVAPIVDAIHLALKAALTFKLSEVMEFQQRRIELNDLEMKFRQEQPLYMIEHLRSQLA